MNDLALAAVIEQGVRFETGAPVTFRYLRNTEKAPFMGSRFGQDIEPAGRYLLHNETPGQIAPTWESGVITFQKPLVLKLSLDGDIYGPTGWKARLRDAYGATGADLSRRLLAEGWDGIVTVSEFVDAQGRVHMDTREIVDLASAGRSKNPPIGAPWLTPQVAARLRDLERRHIKERTRLFGREKGLFVCETAPDEAIDLVEVESGRSGQLVHGVVLHHGLAPSNWPNIDVGQLERPYFHWWIELDDGTIVDVASSQFGQRSPLVIPPRHPMQRLYVKEDPDADELPSGYAPLLLRNPETSLEAFLHELPTFLGSPQAQRVLDGMRVRGRNPWLRGGCFVLAEALVEFLGPKAVALDVESLGLDLHAVVEVNGVWIDGRGAYPPSETKRLFPGMAGVTRHEAMAEGDRVDALVTALRSRFGRVNVP